MKKTTVYLPDDLKAELERTAEETGRGEAEIIRESIRSGLSLQRPPKPRGGLFDSGGLRLSERVDDLLKGFGTR